MTNEQSTLLALLSKALFNKSIDLKQDDYNWEKIYQEDIDYKQVSSERLAKKKMVFFQCYEGYTPDTNRE